VIKYFYATALLFALLLAPAIGQDGPVLKFAKDLHDFGDIDKGDKVTHEFAFENAGKSDLTISDVKPSCGCTTATPEKATYKPGEKGVIPVTFDSGRFSGVFSKTITVTSNDEANPKIQLKIKGKILQDINIEPSRLNLVNVKRGVDLEKEILVSTDRMEKVEVTKVTANIDYLTFDTVRVDDRNVKVMVTFKAADVPREKKRVNGMIDIETNSESQQVLKVGVYINIADPINANPRTVHFFASKKGEERETIINLKSMDQKAFKVLEAHSDLDYITVEEIEPGKLKVTLTQDTKSGRFNGKITVKTDMSDMPELEIPVRGSVI
jgi:hypothetical protein